MENPSKKKKLRKSENPSRSIERNKVTESGITLIFWQNLLPIKMPCAVEKMINIKVCQMIEFSNITCLILFFNIFVKKGGNR